MEQKSLIDFKWIYYDIILILLIIIVFLVIKKDMIMISAFFVLIIYLILTKRSKSLKYLVVSTIIATIWVIIAGKIYGYGSNNFITIGNVTLFPIFAWATGLYALKHFMDYMVIRDNWKKIVISSIIFWVLLLTVEILAYHTFNVRNAATSNYPGLPICDCIHGPVYMQITYLLMGPIYYLLTLLLDKIYKKH